MNEQRETDRFDLASKARCCFDSTFSVWLRYNQTSRLANEQDAIANPSLETAMRNSIDLETILAAAIAVLATGVGLYNLVGYCRMVDEAAEAVHQQLVP